MNTFGRFNVLPFETAESFPAVPSDLRLHGWRNPDGFALAIQLEFHGRLDHDAEASVPADHLDFVRLQVCRDPGFSCRGVTLLRIVTLPPC